MPFVINFTSLIFSVFVLPPGSTLCKDLRLYLSKCFTPGSVDSQLQQVIRENLYLRAVPCKSIILSSLVRSTSLPQSFVC